MNYHKYVSVPTPPRRSEITTTMTTASSVQHDANSACSASVPVCVLGDITPAKEATVLDSRETTTTTGSSVQHDANSDGSASVPVRVLGGITPAAVATASDTREPTTNGVEKGVNASLGGGAACPQTGGTGSGEVTRPTTDAVPTASQTPEKRNRGRPRKVRIEPKTEPADQRPKVSGGVKKKKKRTKKKPRVKSMFRRPLTGELGQRLYTMPPLPPTSTSLAAFKSLLLDRLRLLRTAGVFRVDNVLSVPRELQHELNPEATGLAVKAETSRDAGGLNGTSSGASAAGSSKEPWTGARVATQERDSAGRQYSGPCPPILRSQPHADHWMRTIRNTHDYQMLRSRFMSLFVWPALLSYVRVKDPSGDEADTRSATVASLLGSGRLVVDPNEPDEEPSVEQPVTSGHKVWRFVRPQYR